MIYLAASITWNAVFKYFHIHYSRANILILSVDLLLGLIIYLFHRHQSASLDFIKHIIMLYIVFIFISLYFGSGYTEAWSFFLLIPMISGFYGSNFILTFYSFVGFLAMLFVMILFPVHPKIYDAIDVSNRIFLYIIIISLSYLLTRRLLRLYQEQVNIIVRSSDKTIEQVVKGFVIAIEAKDSYTFGHSDRVSRYAVELAKSVPGFQEDKQLRELRLTGLLHDIGKINIPEAILTKPSRLTEEEYEIIKTHPVVGARMMEQIEELESLKKGVLYHHERWDGLGYPAQLKGEAIPLEARILAVADAFDAMTSSRAYRKAKQFNESFDILMNGKGTQFDPELISILQLHQNEWHELYMELQEDLDDFEQLTNLI